MEKVDGGDEQYPMESHFAVRHTPPDEQDPCFDRSTPTKVRFLRFAVRHTPPDQQDPVLIVGGPTQVRFLRFAVRQTPPDEQDPVSNMAGRTQGRFLLLRYDMPCFHRLFCPSPLDEHDAFHCLPMNTTHSVTSP